jgi:ATP-binding cassette subfamily G (WHITE) protein 2 (SNQ2)
MDDSNVPINHSTIREQTEGATFEANHPERPHMNASRNSGSTFGDKDGVEKYNANGVSNVSGGVNVQKAQNDFAELSKELSRTSNLSRKISRDPSRKPEVISDIEKSPESDASSENAFDLETVLRGNRDEEEAAGIKSKRIGVLWDGLTVSGIGGVKNYVKVRHDRPAHVLA